MMWSFIRQSFVRGLAVIVPLVITVWVLNALFVAMDRIISPLLRQFGWDIPGLGFLIMVLLILAVGMLSRNLVGKFLLKMIEGVMTRIPLARTIYSAVRDIISAFSLGAKGKSFRQVVLVEYPRAGIYSIGFVTNDIQWKAGQGKATEMVSVYFPHPPNPTSGIMILVPRSQAIVLELSVEEGLKLALSGGIVAPERLVPSRKTRSQRKPH